MKTTLKMELSRAQRRLNGALQRQAIAHEAAELERKRIALIQARMNAGAGHVLTPDPDPEVRWIKQEPTSCRLCGSLANSINGQKRCPGDTHECQAEVPTKTSDRAFSQWKGTGWRCGQPGRFSSDFSTWTCTDGHVTAAKHQNGCLRDCACRYLASKDGA